MAVWRRISIGFQGDLAGPSVRSEIGWVYAARRPMVDGMRANEGVSKWLESLRRAWAGRVPRKPCRRNIRGPLPLFRRRFAVIGPLSPDLAIFGLLHSQCAFGIGLPLPARDRRHPGCGCS